MDTRSALDAFNALGQSTRLAVFRLLVQAGPQGLAAGAISTRLGVVANTLSTHLAILTDAHLITGTREGRFVRYAADLAGFRGLVTWLTVDCCGGRPELCAPLLPTTLCKC